MRVCVCVCVCVPFTTLQCTDAVSVDVEEQLYKEAERLGITIITISQRAALTTHHTKELQPLGTNAAWTLESTQRSEDGQEDDTESIDEN